MIFGAANAQVLLLVSLAAVFAAVIVLVTGIAKLLGKGFQSYEERYVAGATRTLDAMYLTMTPRQIISLSILAALALFIVFAATSRSIILGSVLAAFGFVAPIVTVKFLKHRRDKKFGAQLVDGLIAMGNALRVGHSLPAAFELLAREMDNPMGQEMRLLVQELRLGVSLDDALRHLHDRMPGEDLDILMTSIAISREVGGNLAEIFDNIADTIRERHRIQGKIAALTAQGKLQGAVIAVLPVVIGLFLNAWSPQLFRPMFTHWLGLLMIAAIIVMEAVGCFMILKIVSIKM